MFDGGRGKTIILKDFKCILDSKQALVREHKLECADGWR